MSPKKSTELEWFDQPDPTGQTDTNEVGLRFECTQCGKCCTGPTGFVLFTDTEASAMAKDLNMTIADFMKTHTRKTIVGQSLKETVTKHGYDCVFLFRDEHGKALCKVYKNRPEQCQTWPFWRSNLESLEAWQEEAEDCPGMDEGPLHTPKHIRLTRDRVDI